MFWIRRLRGLFYAVFILSSAYMLLTLTRGIVSLAGATQLPFVEGLQFSLGALLAVGLMLLVGAIGLVFIVGYVVLTGWLGSSRTPLLLRLIASFLLGLTVVGLAAPLGAFIPIPLLPVVLVTAGFWLLLRKLSGLSSSVAGRDKILVEQAEAIALQTLQARLPNIALTATGSRMEENGWNISFIGSNGEPYQALVDSRTGSLYNWGKIHR
jgi:hypothetical protein